MHNKYQWTVLMMPDRSTDRFQQNPFKAALERRDLSCTYLAHHELQSVRIIVVIITIITISSIVIIILLLFLQLQQSVQLTATGVPQVVLEFPEVFWTPEYDYFGAAVDGGPELRGRCFMFWNGARFSGAPILTSIISGKLISFFELQKKRTWFTSAAFCHANLMAWSQLSICVWPRPWFLFSDGFLQCVG